MAARLTPAQQQTEMGEGLAVGCLVVGVTAMTSDEPRLDGALTHAPAPSPWLSSTGSGIRWRHAPTELDDDPGHLGLR